MYRHATVQVLFVVTGRCNKMYINNKGAIALALMEVLYSTTGIVLYCTVELSILIGIVVL